MTKYSIEFAHIYLNQSIGKEHERSVRLFHKLANELHKKEEDFSSLVLVDDYNATERILDVQELVNFFQEKGARPDFVAYESKLTTAAQKVLDMSHGSEKKLAHSFYATNGKLPCSLFIATWYLIRLGKIEVEEDFIDWDLSLRSEFETAEKLINILPDYYKGVEKRAMKLLQEGPYADVVSLIDNQYFDS